jgi:hypothetical protein
MNLPSCPECASILDVDDNFCRRCGASISARHLPSVRGPVAATIWQPRVPRVMKGAAVMAAGTVGQYIVRRLVRNVIGGGNARASRALRRRPDDGMIDDAQIITETVMMRRVRIRRQA